MSEPAPQEVTPEPNLDPPPVGSGQVKSKRGILTEKGIAELEIATGMARDRKGQVWNMKGILASS